jgi:hypothetical protein
MVCYQISTKYGVGKSTISGLKKQKAAIESFMTNLDLVHQCEDDEIVSSVFIETCTSDVDDETAADDESNPDIPTHSEAFTCLDKALLWFEAQDESDEIQLNFLKKIRDSAARKRIGALKQKKNVMIFFKFCRIHM